jgi:hypothetical protein
LSINKSERSVTNDLCLFRLCPSTAVGQELLNPDYAMKSDHTHSIHSKSALSRKLVVNKIIFYRSVKNSHLAALKNREKQHSP